MKNSIKLNSDQIKELIDEKEAFLNRELEREQFNKSLRRLLAKAQKKGFHLNKKLFAHVITELDRFYFSDSEMSV